MDEEEKDLERVRQANKDAFQRALMKLYDQGPSPEQPFGDPVVLFRQLAPFTRRWLQHLDEDDTQAFTAFAKQYQAAGAIWRGSRKVFAWMGATILATLAFGEQILRLLDRLRAAVW